MLASQNSLFCCFVFCFKIQSKMLCSRMQTVKRLRPSNTQVSMPKRRATSSQAGVRAPAFIGSSDEYPDIFRLFFLKWKTDTHTKRHRTNTQKYFVSILHELFLQICLAVWISLRMKWIRDIASMATCLFVIGWEVSRHLHNTPESASTVNI